MIFDQAQEDVLADEHDCLLVEAPPGSGKTHTAVRLVARDIDAARIGPTQRALVLTFSRNARSQLDSYAAELLTPSQRARTEITNYHAWFWQKVINTEHLSACRSRSSWQARHSGRPTSPP